MHFLSFFLFTIFLDVMELNKQQRAAERLKNFQAKYKMTVEKEEKENGKVM